MGFSRGSVPSSARTVLPRDIHRAPGRDTARSPVVGRELVAGLRGPTSRHAGISFRAGGKALLRLPGLVVAPAAEADPLLLPDRRGHVPGDSRLREPAGVVDGDPRPSPRGLARAA